MARISELHYSNAFARSTGIEEFLEVALSPGDDPADFTVSFYQSDGRVGIEIPLTDPDVRVTTDPETAETIYVISAADFPILLTDPNGGGSNNYEAYALVNTDTSDVIDFYDIGGGTQNIVALDGLAQGAVSENIPVIVGPNDTTTTIQFNQPDPDQVAYDAPSEGDTGIVCFVSGTRLMTAAGPREIDTLALGDQILNRDGAAKRVTWIGRRRVAGTGALAPIRIRKGTLGAQRDVFVSPQHRLLVTGWQAELYFAADEVLVPAKALINGTTIARVPCRHVTYFHILFDSHQIVLSDGLASESFFPGICALDALAPQATAEIYALFPELAYDPSVYGPCVRPVGTAREAQLLRIA